MAHIELPPMLTAEAEPHWEDGMQRRGDPTEWKVVIRYGGARVVAVPPIGVMWDDFHSQYTEEHNQEIADDTLVHYLRAMFIHAGAPIEEDA
jgi:hypothetical protein